MIIWYCDICGKRITDDCSLKYIEEGVCELSGTTQYIYNVKDRGQSKGYMKMIVCESCEAYLIDKIYKTVQQAIKDRKGEINKVEEE